MKNLMLILMALLALNLVSCSSAPKQKGFELPIALSETFRNGQLKGLEQADSEDLGLPNQRDMVSHVCNSEPIYDLWGRYVRTDIRCW